MNTDRETSIDDLLARLEPVTVSDYQGTHMHQRTLPKAFLRDGKVSSCIKVIPISRTEVCGVVGTWGQAGSDINAQRAYVTRAQAKIIQRGPDAMGVWADPENSLVFGHTRLSVVELSSSGAQPMLSKSGRYAISFNGEIYNHQSLRDELRLQKARCPLWVRHRISN